MHPAKRGMRVNVGISNVHEKIRLNIQVRATNCVNVKAGIVRRSVVGQVKRPDVEIALSIVPMEAGELLNPPNIVGLDLNVQSGVISGVPKLQPVEADTKAPIHVEWIVGIFVGGRCQPPRRDGKPLNREWSIGIYGHGRLHTLNVAPRLPPPGRQVQRKQILKFSQAAERKARAAVR